MQQGDRVSVHAGPDLTFEGHLRMIDEVSGYVFVVSDDRRRAAWVHRAAVHLLHESSDPLPSDAASEERQNQ